MKILRTPEARFAGLEGYPFAPRWTDVKAEGAALRVHHFDEGKPDAPLVLCMHGQPVWSYLYRKMAPLLTGAGLRVVAPDLPGYGKSDKPAAREDYSYQRQVDWMGAWLVQNDFTGITLFGQDWGGLIGLRLVAAHPERFARVVISNTGLPYNPEVPEAVVEQVEAFRAEAPTPTLPAMTRALSGMQDDAPAARFAYWQKFCWETERLPIGFMMSMMMERRSAPSRLLALIGYQLGLSGFFRSPLAKAYEAPFPDSSYMMGPRAMPSQVPTLPTDPSLEAQRKAWDFFSKFEKPFLCAFADNDPVTAGQQSQFLEKVPGAKGLSHPTIKDGGHFVQETSPDQVAQAIIELIRST